jgi:methionine transaminase
MSSLALQHNAVNLGQGFPDFPMNDELIELVNQAMRDGHNQYVHMNGLPALREGIAEKCNVLYNATLSSDDITITPGGTYAIYTALTSILNPGDEVIVFEPAYDSYIPNIEVNGAVAVRVGLIFPEYRIDWEKVKESVTARTRAIIINSPHNPTGSILTEDDIRELRAIVDGTDIIIISDEVYEHLIFENKTHLSILNYPDLFQRSFVCFSFGKVYHCTGWKLGYCIAPGELMKEFRKIHQFNCFTCNSPAQFALSVFIKQRTAYAELGKFLQQKRDYFQKGMSQTKFIPLPSYGSYFQLYSYKDISAEAEADFAIKLTKEAGVATIPVSAFYKTPVNNQVLRFCFSKKESTLDEAINRLIRF